MQKQQLNTWYAELVNIYATSSDATAEKKHYRRAKTRSSADGEIAQHASRQM